MPFSYNGWRASPDPESIGVDSRWEPIPGHRFPGGIKAGDVETVFTYLVQQLDKRVEPIEEYPPGDEWGYSYRANVNNPATLSCHSSGTAIDYNATQHPNQVDFTWTQAQTREIHRILDELDGVIRWLEGWDEMHFEVRATRDQVAAVATKIRRGDIPPKPRPQPPKPQPPIDLGDDDMALIRRVEDRKHSVLIVPDKSTPIGVRGFHAVASDDAGDSGLSSEVEVDADRGAWHQIVDVWLKGNKALTST